jgi:hypothetical protein
MPADSSVLCFSKNTSTINLSHGEGRNSSNISKVFQTTIQKEPKHFHRRTASAHTSMTKICDVAYDDSCTRFLENAARYKRHPHKRENQIGHEFRVGYYSTGYSSFKPKSAYISHNHKHFAFSDALGLINERPTLSDPSFSDFTSVPSSRASRRSTSSDRSVRHLGNLFDSMQTQRRCSAEQLRRTKRQNVREKENKLDLFNPHEQVINQIAAFEERLTKLHNKNREQEEENIYEETEL